MVKKIVELIRKTSVESPSDVETAIKNAVKKEKEDSMGESILQKVIENVKIAKNNLIPICQDTGYLIFYIYHPPEIPQSFIRKSINNAVNIATMKGYLRPNAVDSLTGANSSNNLGLEFPEINFIQWRKKDIRIDLLLKGGGCENAGRQYSLPDEILGAERDLDGVFKCAIDTVLKAQGKACAPGFLGIGIGGNRVSSYKLSMEQFFKKVNQKNKSKILNTLENKILKAANVLEIGPMGLGGATTLLGVKVGAIHRVPASYFVSVSYMCWAFRRGSIIINGNQ